MCRVSVLVSKRRHFKIHNPRWSILGDRLRPRTRLSLKAELDLGTRTSFIIYTFSNTVEINVA